MDTKDSQPTLKGQTFSKASTQQDEMVQGISSGRLSPIFRQLYQGITALTRITDGRLRAWRGAGVTIGLLGLFAIATLFYSHLHGFDPRNLLEHDEFVLPSLQFIKASSFVQVGVEIAYWSSIGILVRRLSISARNARRIDFDFIVYFNEVVTEWVSLPIIATFSVLLMSVLHIKLGEGFDFSVGTASIEFIIGLGFILGFFGSKDVIHLLEKVRDYLEYFGAKRSSKLSRSSKQASKPTKQ